MGTVKQILLGGALLCFAGCSSPVACETIAECGADEASRGFLCVASACEPCESDVECAGSYGAGARCGDGRCTAAGCSPGEEGCACGDGDVCDAGLMCAAGLCVAGVPTGCEGCPCGAGGSCDTGLSCVDGTCGPPLCPAGTEGCACFSGGTCGSGLSCEPATSLCVPCTPGEAMCSCGVGGACGTGLRCEASPMCPPGAIDCCLPSECGTGTEGTLGCTCSTSDPPCGPGAVCRGGLCVCGDQYVGARCEIACTDTQRMVSEVPVFNPDADQGFWLCGHFAASDEGPLGTGALTVRGEVPITPTDGAVLRGGTITVSSR